MNPSTVPLLINEFNAAIDTGKYDSVTVDEIMKHIEYKTVFDFLERSVPEVRNLPEPDVRAELSTYWYDLWAAYGHPSSKWGVRNRGLCLLIAWTAEIVNSGMKNWRFQLKEI
jgi:hypothetical protein